MIRRLSATRTGRSLAFASKVALTLVVCDLVLSGGALVSARIRFYLSPPWDRARVPDPVLGHRMSPFHPGHDARGYRNPKVPSSTTVLAIGDSMTYGYAATADSSWPRQLETLSGLSTYNAGVGGYGPCEYDRVLDELLAFRPSVVLVGLFAGNDFRDAYRSVYLEGRCPHLRQKDFQNTKPRQEGSAGQGFDTPPADSAGPSRQWLSRHSSLYSLARSVYFTLRPARYGSEFREAPDRLDSFETAAARASHVVYDADAQLRTVFLPPGEVSRAIDLKDPAIREGRRITEAVLLSMRDRVTRTGARIVVVFIPSKPSVYVELIERSTVRPQSMNDGILQQAAATDQLVMDMRDFLDRNRIAYADTTAALRAYLRRGLAPFPETDDPHPNATGYRAIAEAVAPLVASVTTLGHSN